jgi:hypothetical protein
MGKPSALQRPAASRRGSGFRPSLAPRIVSAAAIRGSAGYAAIGLNGQAREQVEQEVVTFAGAQRIVDANDAASGLGAAMGPLDPALSDAINALPVVMSPSASTPPPLIVDALLANCICNLP